MEEFFEWLSAKRLGKHLGALIIFNFEGYYDPLIELLNKMEKEKFHAPIHSSLWRDCSRVDEILDTIAEEPDWGEDLIQHASVKS